MQLKHQEFQIQSGCSLTSETRNRIILKTSEVDTVLHVIYESGFDHYLHSIRT